MPQPTRRSYEIEPEAPRVRMLNQMARKLIPVACALLVAALLAGPAAAAPKMVTIKGSLGLYHFKPGTVTIHKGKTVSWSWDSDADHNVKFGKKLAGKHSKTKSKITDFRITFKNVGTFKYKCTVHGFTGKVVVTAP
jgi:plastocyanin